jgi:Cu(I)/Ag(I) efflux system membrane fusion protein
MGLPDTSPVPKTDAMGMPYVPVYADEIEEPGTVAISRERVQMLGVRTKLATRRPLTREVRAVGLVQLDERRISVISARVEGWIERLLVNTTGQTVRAGEPLLEIYSPALVQTQEELLIAARTERELAGAGSEAVAGVRAIVAGAIRRLRNWNISEEQIATLRRTGRVNQRMVITAPAAGIVMEKPALEGMRIMPGDMLYRIADLSQVWVVAEVFERDLHLIRQGQSVRVTVNAHPEAEFTGTVDFVYPSLTAATRTARVRIAVPNPDRLLLVDMYANVEIRSTLAEQAVMVPDSAVLDTGQRQYVLVQRGEGRFQPRPIEVGLRADGYAQVLSGLAAGEPVVVSANFLIDSEANLRAALQSFSGHSYGSDASGNQP